MERTGKTATAVQGALLGALLSVMAALPGVLPVRAQALGEQTGLREARMAAFYARRDSLIDYFARRIDPGNLSEGGPIDVAARLYRGEDLDWTLARLDSILAEPPRGDMFWMYPTVLVTFLGHDRLPDAYQDRMRARWRTYTPYRGDTENHWAMYYTALYLMAQYYPEQPGTSWFNGKSSAENLEEARAYLLHWMALTTTIGQGEYDSPWYMSYYVVAMAELYAFAEDASMKQRARMMLDYLLADFAVESLDGLYVGGHSRIYPEPLLDRWQNNSTSFAWLLFGNTPFLPRGDAMILAMSGYEPPEILYRIATDRSAPYVHRERKRTRNRIRFSELRNAPVYKYTAMRPAYALASTQGGLLQPIQQHTWELFWRADDPKKGHNQLFTIHPYADGYELAMYFPEEPKLLTEAVVKSKGTYNSPDKWTGASPFEQVFQHEDALVVLYDIPPGTRFPFISGFFSRALTQREEDPSGWIFCQGGEAFIAYYALAPYVWQIDPDSTNRLHSTALKNGAVVQVAPASAYASMDAFKRAVRGLRLETETEPVPRVRYETLGGSVLEARYGAEPRVDGAAVDYGSWPLYGGAFLEAAVGSGVLLMKYGNMRRRLDFEALSITDWVEEEKR